MQPNRSESARPEPSRPELVQLCLNGDQSAWARLVEEYRGLVYSICILFCGSTQDAEDLMQDVFVKALKQLPNLREPAAFPGWLIAIARRTATDYLRSRTSTPLPVDPLRSAGASPDGEAFAVLALIQSLPESYRETLVLRLVEGMTGPEIAARTGLTPDSVRVNICRGMKLLRDQLEGRK